MKNVFVSMITIILLTSLLNNLSFGKGEKDAVLNLYFPTTNNIVLVYESSFGECITKYFKDGDFTVSASQADKFKYRQELLIKDDGVYVNETYQYLKVLLFIKKEGTITYTKPLLRFPLPLLPGKEWKSEGEEISDGVKTPIRVSGKIYDKEFIATKAGKFSAIKIVSLVEGASNSKNRVTEWFVEGIGLIKANIVIEGGGIMGFLRDMLGYGTIEFELKEIKKI